MRSIFQIFKNIIPVNISCDANFRDLFSCSVVGCLVFAFILVPSAGIHPPGISLAHSVRHAAGPTSEVPETPVLSVEL